MAAVRYPFGTGRKKALKIRVVLRDFGAYQPKSPLYVGVRSHANTMGSGDKKNFKKVTVTI
jgi:hypothetical protein